MANSALDGPKTPEVWAVPVWRRGEDDAGEDHAARWLLENDGRSADDCRRAEMAADIASRFAGTFITADDVRAAFAPGRPTKDRRHTRRAIREALSDLYSDGERRDLLADVLGCSRQALHTLMAKP